MLPLLSQPMILPIAVTLFSSFSPFALFPVDILSVDQADSISQPGTPYKNPAAIAHRVNPPSGNESRFLAQNFAAQEYQIRLNALPPTSNVGDQYRLSIRDHEVTTSKGIEGDRVEETVEKFGLELVADVTILTIDSEKLATSLSLKVIQSKAMLDNTESVPFSEGTTLIASLQDERTVFSINGDRIEGQLEKSLSNVVDLKENREADDAVFGTSTPRRVGENWNINSKNLAVDLPGVNPQDISGTATLNEVRDNFLLVSSLVQIKNALSYAIPSSLLAIEKDEVLMELSWRLPVDTARNNFYRTVKLTGTVFAISKTNPGARIEIDYESITSHQIRNIE